MDRIKVVPSIDQATIVLQATEDISVSHWDTHAQSLMETFMTKARLSEVFGFEEKGRLFEGYNRGMTTINAPFYCCIAYHDTIKSMGIVIHFSGWAYHRYQEKTKWKLYDLFQQAMDPSYTMRLSRLDNAIDIINSEIDVDELYKSIIEKNTIVQHSSGRKNSSKFKPYIEENLDVASFYIGSLKRSDTILRVYDKKAEMIDTNGHLKNYYEQFDTVIRFEQKLKGKLVHQATDKLKAIETDDELKDFIISSVTNKYCFFDIESQSYRIETEVMLKALKENNFEFKSIQSRANSLEQTRDYLMSNSGLFTYLHKLDMVYGEGTATEGINDLQEQFEQSTPNESVEKWLTKYKSLYQEQPKPWEDSVFNNELVSNNKGVVNYAK